MRRFQSIPLKLYPPCETEDDIQNARVRSKYFSSISTILILFRLSQQLISLSGERLRFFRKDIELILNRFQMPE